MAQGHDAHNSRAEQPFSFEPYDIDHVIITHAHIDHSGLLPLLKKLGYKGYIHSTDVSCSLMEIMLKDSAQIQESDAAYANRKGNRQGATLVEPLFTSEDALDTIESFLPHSYHEIVELCPGVRFRLVDAGHLLGSASVEMWLEEDGVKRKVVFSGDIGNKNMPIIRDPEFIRDADYVLMESTYGDRNHEVTRDYAKEISEILEETFTQGG
ncbi:MAG: MBL fold metallo-hydrolase, partial [Symbiobacteriaceae bacterium]|nr:MBL fold metallo-hydrolase [Symbiobacteriaceae bacterium]